MGNLSEKWVLNLSMAVALTVPLFLIISFTDKDGGSSAYSVITTPAPLAPLVSTGSVAVPVDTTTTTGAKGTLTTGERSTALPSSSSNSSSNSSSQHKPSAPAPTLAVPHGESEKEVDVDQLLAEDEKEENRKSGTGGREKGEKVSPERQAYIDRIFKDVHPGHAGPGPDGKHNTANDLPRGMTAPPSTPDIATNIATTAETRVFFKDTLLILMLSPPRYSYARTTYNHYSPYFVNIHVCGPKKNETDEIELQGLKVKLYDIVYGNEQYRATSRIIKQYEENSDPAEREKFTGYLYLADDLMLHPWALAGPGRKNKTVPWAGSMGMANVLSAKPLVTAIPAMSIEPQFRNMPWPYWRKNKGKLLRALLSGGTRMRNALRMAGLSTHPYVIMKSKYNMKHYNLQHLGYSVYFTIVDTYYIPKHLSLPLAYYFDLMAKNWVFGECAIATALRAVHPTYQEMSLQFYWSVGTAVGCPRHKWHSGIDGFHRCHHNHPFAHLMFDESSRSQLRDNTTFWRQSTKLEFNDSIPDTPLTDSPYEA